MCDKHFSKFVPIADCSYISHMTFLLGAQQNDVNARIILPGTHCSTRWIRLKSCHLLQSICKLLFICFICQNFIPSKSLSSNIISCNLFTMLMGFYLLFTSFCREQAKRSHCQFSCSTLAFMSSCRAHAVWYCKHHLQNSFVSHYTRVMIGHYTDMNPIKHALKYCHICSPTKWTEICVCLSLPPPPPPNSFHNTTAVLPHCWQERHLNVSLCKSTKMECHLTSSTSHNLIRFHTHRISHGT